MKKIIAILIIICMLIIIGIHNVYAEWKINVPQKIIDDGIYEIEIEEDATKVVDISEASKLSNANVQIWERYNVLQQRFEFKYSDGYYTIKSVNSGKLLDVQYGSMKDGANVQQYVSNSTDAQKWEISKTEDGKYNIISKLNGLYLTANGLKDGNNINVKNKSSLENQKFILKKVEEQKCEKVLEDGIYKISLIDTDKVMDISEASMLSRANVQVWQDVDVSQQKFYLKYEDGYYSIINTRSGKYLEATSGKIIKGTNVQQFSSNSTEAQKWIIKKTEDGYYNIISKLAGINLEVVGGENNGDNIRINLSNDKKNQKFDFIQTDGEIPILKNGIYQIVTKLAGNMVLDISNGEAKDGTNVQLWADTNVNQQKFEFVHVKNGYYKIISKKTGKALTVSKKANVYQSTYTGSDEQLWSLKVTGEYYNIISKYNGKYLDVQNGNTSNGANIWVYTGNNSDAQKFILEQRKYGIDVSHWQNTIDFKTLSADGKINFMIIRVGQGTTVKDRKFEYNYEEAKKYNIPVGAYLYAKAQSIEEVRAEANYLVDRLKGKNFEVPIYYDIEEHEGLDNETITKMCLEYYKILKNAGLKPGIYASKYYLKYKMDVTKIPSDCSIWAASYGENTGAMPKFTYKYQGKHDIWQYTSRGSLPGIIGDVDYNIMW